MASRGVNKVILVGNLGGTGSTLHAEWWRSCQHYAGYFRIWRDKATGEMKRADRMAPRCAVWQTGRSGR